MIFDDSFFQLTGGKGPDSGKTAQWTSIDKNKDKEDSNAESTNATVSKDEPAKQEEPIPPGPADLTNVVPGEKWSSEYGNPDFDYVIESDLVIPSVKPKKNEASKPIILAIDDDFASLDLMKIYFARGYEYVPFSGPREAIFYLNENLPDVIFLDCFIHTIKAARVVDIIHSYSELKNVPIYYLCDDYEKSAMENKLPEGVLGIIERPVSRKAIQEVLDKHFPKDAEEK